MITIRPGEGCKALEPAKVAEIEASNESRSQALRDSFYERANEAAHINTQQEGGEGTDDHAE